MEKALARELPAKNLHRDQVFQDLRDVFLGERGAALESDLEVGFRLLELGVKESHATAVVLEGDVISVGEDLEIRPHRPLGDVDHFFAVLVLVELEIDPEEFYHNVQSTKLLRPFQGGFARLAVAEQPSERSHAGAHFVLLLVLLTFQLLVCRDRHVNQLLAVLLNGRPQPQPLRLHEQLLKLREGLIMTVKGLLHFTHLQRLQVLHQTGQELEKFAHVLLVGLVAERVGVDNALDEGIGVLHPLEGGDLRSGGGLEQVLELRGSFPVEALDYLLAPGSEFHLCEKSFILNANHCRNYFTKQN